MRILGRLIAAVVYIAGPSARVDALPAERPAGGGPIMAVGIFWGLAMIGLWDLGYRLTWERYTWVLPSVLCALATVGLAYRRAFEGPLGLIGLGGWLKWPALAALAAAWAYAVNEAVRYWGQDWPTQQLSPAIIWLWPRALYRVLLLGPVWGSWAMLALPQFHRPNERTDPHTRALARGTSPLAAALYLAAPLAGTLVYLMFLPQPFRFAPPAAAVAAALGGGSLMVVAFGGLCRRALLAANVLTQAAFLWAYLLVR